MGTRTAEYLSQLPDRGWGVLRCPEMVVLVLHAAGLVHVEVTAHPGVFQARLTGAGRSYLRAVDRPVDRGVRNDGGSGN